MTFFKRTARSLLLTEDGYLFKEQEKIINLVDKTDALLKQQEMEASGDIHIGYSESECNRVVMKAMAKTQQKYPNIKFHIATGNAQFVIERLDQGLFDLGIVVDLADLTKYDFIKLSSFDTRGILMRKDNELAKLDEITSNDLRNKALIVPNQEIMKNEIAGSIGENIKHFLKQLKCFKKYFRKKLIHYYKKSLV